MLFNHDLPVEIIVVLQILTHYLRLFQRTVESRYLEYSISRTQKQSVPSLSIYTKRLLDKSNSRCLEQIFWSLDSSRYRELTVYNVYTVLFDHDVPVEIILVLQILTHYLFDLRLLHVPDFKTSLL